MQSFASPETFPISKIASQEMAIYFCLGAGANLAEVRVMMRMPGIEITLTKMIYAKMICMYRVQNRARMPRFTACPCARQRRNALTHKSSPIL